MANLSPAAQAVIYAWSKIAYDDKVDITFKPLPWEHKAIAAALRAAADQVVPAEPEDKELDLSNRDDNHEWCQWSERMHTRNQLLAIATELDSNQTI